MKGLKKELTRGFTLVELIIVIVIIGILAAIAVPQFTSVRGSAEQASYAANVANIQSQLTALFAKNTDVTGDCAAAHGLVIAENPSFAEAGSLGELDEWTGDGPRCDVTYSVYDEGTTPLTVGLPWAN